MELVPAFGLGRYAEALESYDRALQLRKRDYWAIYRKGDVYLQCGDYNQALSFYDDAISIQPEYEDAWIYRGWALLYSGRLDEAQKSYEKALELNDYAAEAWYGKACCAALREDVVLAVECLQEALLLLPGEYNQQAMAEPAFDGIREDERFLSLFGR